MRNKLALVFNIVCAANAIGALVAGVMMDICGTHIARMVAGLIVCAGAMMIAYAEPESILWFPGLAYIGFGDPCGIPQGYGFFPLLDLLIFENL